MKRENYFVCTRLGASLPIFLKVKVKVKGNRKKAIKHLVLDRQNIFHVA